MFFFQQREIAVASDEAARAYLDKTPKEEQTANAVWDVMTEASERLVESIKKKDFTKYLAIANPKNGDDFLNEVTPSLMPFTKLRMSTSFPYFVVSKIITLHADQSTLQ